MVSPANHLPASRMARAFYFDRGQSRVRLACPLCANSGHRQSLFDHLVCAAGQGQRDVDAQRLSGLQVDVQLDFRDLLNR